MEEILFVSALLYTPTRINASVLQYYFLLTPAELDWTYLVYVAFMFEIIWHNREIAMLILNKSYIMQLLIVYRSSQRVTLTFLVVFAALTDMHPHHRPAWVFGLQIAVVLVFYSFYGEKAKEY